MKIGYQASHEQFSPSRLRYLVGQAEAAGFEFVLASDHIMPWSETQGNSGFVWSWLGSAMEHTSLEFAAVSPPGFRYHPVVLAQAIATLDDLYPGRFLTCLGSGEALNEHVVGQGWPDKSRRNQILQESADVMRRLWRGETVSHQGAVTVDEAKLYVLPGKIPPIYGAALTESTARWIGSWADGLLTIGGDGLENLNSRLTAFQGDAVTKKPVIVKVAFAYGHTRDAAIEGGYKQWRYLFLPPEALGNLRTPAEFEAATEEVSEDDVADRLKIITSIDQLQDWVDEFRQLGIDRLVLHNVVKNQQLFLDDVASSKMLVQ